MHTLHLVHIIYYTEGALQCSLSYNCYGVYFNMSKPNNFAMLHDLLACCNVITKYSVKNFAVVLLSNLCFTLGMKLNNVGILTHSLFSRDKK